MTHEAVRSRASARAIIHTVAAFHRLQVDVLIGERRSRGIVWPRQEACWVLRSRTSLSLPSIGRLMGNRDHSTVMFAIVAVERRRATDPDYCDLTTQLLERVDTLALGHADDDPLTAVRNGLARCEDSLRLTLTALETAQASITAIQAEGASK